MTEDQSAVYPGVEWAYDYVVPSYTWMLTRLQAADTRIQAIQGFAVTFTFGVPAVARALNLSISFSAGRFYLAILCFALLMIIGTVAQARGSVKLANPALFYQNWLHFGAWEFKKAAVYWAGQHFEINGGLIQAKSRAAVAMTALFLVELVFLVAWLITAGS
jgi:hypothetical protein